LSTSKRLLALALASTIGCGKCGSSSSPGKSAGSEGDLEVESVDAGAPPMDVREAAQWAVAGEGEPAELMRLEDLVGCEGLRERAAERRDLMGVAVRAMQYCSDFSELPWLAEVAGSASDADARAALEAIDDLAARPRRATDPEDAEELHAGCSALLTLARSTSRPKERRALAVRALRMLAERGCVNVADIPVHLDGK
jgi:hypothetical protein